MWHSIGAFILSREFEEVPTLALYIFCFFVFFYIIIVPCLKNLDYSVRLTAIGITSLKRRRDRGDLIQMFKITSGQNAVSLHALSNIQVREPLDAPSANLRHIKPRLTRQICNVKARENFFTNRIANNWNNLPDSIVYSSSTNNFKNNLDNFWDQQLAGSETAIAD